ncbi:MAG: hypothetical protein LBJ74_05800 [Heliobacteriaceae bacterium]|jgi:hypothetical protein|nr:hypothetical protein [Heliobacteriaceae bacterium]
MGLDALNKLYEKYSASEKKFEGMSRVQIPKKSGGTINFFKYKNGTFSLQRSGEKGFFYDKNGRLTGVWTDYDPKTNTYMKDILPDIRKRQIEHLAQPEVQQRI